MVNTVGLYGATGNLGKASLPSFLKAHAAQHIKLVILHRSSSKIDSLNLSGSVETRAIDLTGDSITDEQVAQLTGLDVVVSTAGVFDSMPEHMTLVKALKATGGDPLFVPPFFGAKFQEKYPQVGPLVGASQALFDQAERAGVRTFKVNSGLFVNWFLGQKVLGTDIDANSIIASEEQLDHKFPTTSMEYLGAVLADLASRPPSETSGKTYSAVEKWVTGNDLVHAFTVINGSKPEIKDFTRKNFEEDAALGNLVKAAYAINWLDDEWYYPNPVEPEGFETLDLEETLRQYKK